MSATLPLERIHDGFCLRQTRLELPLENSGLDPKLQTDLLICHMFVNVGLPISVITGIGEDYPTVVRALLEQGVVWDRRRKQDWLPTGLERRKATKN
jgi:hypothetical protein